MEKGENIFEIDRDVYLEIDNLTEIDLGQAIAGLDLHIVIAKLYIELAVGALSPCPLSLNDPSRYEDYEDYIETHVERPINTEIADIIFRRVKSILSISVDATSADIIPFHWEALTLTKNYILIFGVTKWQM